jgi:hypothetical protein
MSLEPTPQPPFHFKGRAFDFDHRRNTRAALRYIQARYGDAGRAWIGTARDYAMASDTPTPLPITRRFAADYLRRMAPTLSHGGRRALLAVADWMVYEPGWEEVTERFKVDQLIALRLKPLDGLFYRTSAMSPDPAIARPCFAEHDGPWAIGEDDRLWKWVGAWYPQSDHSKLATFVTVVYSPHAPRLATTGAQKSGAWARVENCPSCRTPTP